MIRPHLSNMMNNLKTQGKWKMELMMTINFMCSKNSKDFNETFTMHTKSNDIEILIGNEADETIKELFNSLLQRNQGGLEESTKGSKPILDGVDLWY